MLSKNPQRKQIPSATLFLMVLHLNLRRSSAKFQVTCILPRFRWLKQMACLVILKICKYPYPCSNCILSLHPFKVKTTEELSLKKMHKGSLRKFCFEIGELFEVNWNVKIGKTDETILNKGQTKGIVSIWFEDLISKIHSGKHYLLCNFLKTSFWEPCCLWGTENIHSHFCFAKTKTSYFKQGRPTKSHPESQKMFSRLHSQNWLLPSGTTPCCCHQGSLLSSKPCEAI